MSHHLEPPDESNVSADPVEQFDQWYRAAQITEVVEATAVNVATVGSDGRPSARMLLLKGFDRNGFVFYTNFNSRKGTELSENPFACLTFWWPSQYRQVRIEGRVAKVSDEESDAYFSERPFGSRIGALASPQSEVVEGRASLEEHYEMLSNRWQGKQVPRPKHWGGYRLKPDRFEFWQSRENRLHDRIVYLREGGEWKVVRLGS